MELLCFRCWWVPGEPDRLTWTYWLLQWSVDSCPTMWRCSHLSRRHRRRLPSGSLLILSFLKIYFNVIWSTKWTIRAIIYNFSRATHVWVSQCNIFLPRTALRKWWLCRGKMFVSQVGLSLRPSHASIVLTRLNIFSHFFHRLLALPF